MKLIKYELINIKLMKYESQMLLENYWNFCELLSDSKSEIDIEIIVS